MIRFAEAAAAAIVVEVVAEVVVLVIHAPSLSHCKSLTWLTLHLARSQALIFTVAAMPHV